MLIDEFLHCTSGVSCCRKFEKEIVFLIWLNCRFEFPTTGWKAQPMIERQRTFAPVNTFSTLLVIAFPNCNITNCKRLCLLDELSFFFSFWGICRFHILNRAQRFSSENVCVFLSMRFRTEMLGWHYPLCLPICLFVVFFIVSGHDSLCNRF